MSEVLGRNYRPGEDIVREGEVGDCMYVIQEGEADVFKRIDGISTLVDSMGTGDLFGEIAILEQTVRSSTVRARTPLKAITLDRSTFLRRVQEDPALALNVLRVMAGRVRRLDDEIARLKQELSAAQSGPHGQDLHGS